MSPVLRAGPVSQARVEALRILVRVEQDKAFADIALEHALERARLPPRDAALCAEIVYGTLRWQRHLDWRLGPHCRRPLAKLDPWVRALLRMTAYQALLLDRVPGWAAVDEAVSLARLTARSPGPPEFVNAVLRALSRAAGPPPLPAGATEALGVRLSFPDWLTARWVGRYGQAEAEALMTALNARPPLTVRANRLRGPRDDLVRRLRDEDLLAARPTELVPDGVRLDRAPAGAWRSFADGSLTIQDQGSMLVARLLDPQPGETVADTCAAPGTKATYLAELMDDRGAVIALDPHAGRLRLVERSAARLGIGIVECHAGSAERLAPRWAGRCQAVLVDAPCSNLGVLRRNPEVKWRRRPEELPRFRDRQRAILEAAAHLVAPGGRLVYATCSLEPDENEDVVQPFLATAPGWTVDRPPAGFPVVPGPRGFVRLLPHVHDTDGFSAVRLRRPPAAPRHLRADAGTARPAT